VVGWGECRIVVCTREWRRGEVPVLWGIICTFSIDAEENRNYSYSFSQQVIYNLRICVGVRWNKGLGEVRHHFGTQTYPHGLDYEKDRNWFSGPRRKAICNWCCWCCSVIGHAANSSEVDINIRQRVTAMLLPTNGDILTIFWLAENRLSTYRRLVERQWHT